MIHITNDSVYEHHVIDDIYKVFVIENVKQYSFVNFNTHRIEVSENKEQPSDYYFAIDLLCHDAFAHWVYESAIYLPIFTKLKEIYPTLKILLKEKKTYKLLFLIFFNITEEDVIYDANMHPNNICLFPSPISSLNHNPTCTYIYKQIIIQFIMIFSKWNASRKSVIYDYIILPRQKKENYTGNDRIYDMEVIYDAIKSITHNYSILHTDTIMDLTNQITDIRAASNVIITDGSPFLVNSMFCNNQKIYVFDTITIHQAQQYDKIKFIIEEICKLNSNIYTYIPTYLSHVQIVELLNRK